MPLKRIFDIGFSIVILVALLPLFAIISALIRLTSSGPTLFRQRRTGFMQKEFTILKFRTMYNSSGRSGIDLVSSSDPRITPVGRMLRKSRLDELPQFWNVLRGEMAVVGPRPYELDATRLLVETEPKAVIRFTVLPGITGLAQVSGRRGKTLPDMASDIAHDLEYINRRTFRLEFWILWRTLIVMLKRGGI